MSEFTDKLREALLNASLPFDESSLTYFEVYKNLLLDWNAHMNLTAIKDEDGIIYKHFVDSLMLLKVVDDFKSLLDVGSGAGFPGVPIKIVKKHIELSLIESQRKKATFLEILLERLTFTDAKVYNARAEELAKETLRESFDVVTEREFGKLPMNLEIGLPFVKVGGHLLLYKGVKDIKKLDIFKIFIEELGGAIERIFPYKLNDSVERYIVSIKKEWHTPRKFPRSYSTILRELKRWGEFA